MKTHHRALRTGISLAVSGGGFRATLFHLGALWRLNQLGYLSKLNRICSVSGGSIVTGLLGSRWRQLEFDAQGVAGNFDTIIASPVREFCQHRIDIPVGLLGLLTWPAVVLAPLCRGQTPGNVLAAWYDLWRQVGRINK